MSVAAVPAPMGRMAPVAARLARVAAAGAPHPDSPASAAAHRAAHLLRQLLSGAPIDPVDAASLGTPWGTPCGAPWAGAASSWAIELTPEGEYRPACRYTITPGGVAIIEVPGVLSHAAGLMGLFWGEYDSGLLAACIRAAAADPAVRGVGLVMDCPGGTVAGAADLEAAADAVRSAGKPLEAIAHETACSAGYALIAMADRITLTPTAVVGSIGTIIPRYDDSAMMAEYGIEPAMIATHPRKAQGWPGVKPDEELDDHLRRLVEVERDRFFARVARGRGLSVAGVEALGARVYVGADAISAGLADRVALAAEWMDEMNSGRVAPVRTTRASVRAAGPAHGPSAGAASQTSTRKERPMPIDWTTVTDQDLAAMPDEIRSKVAPAPAASASSVKPAPATFDELMAAFPSDAGLVVDAMKAGMTLDQARGLSAAREAAAKDRQIADLTQRLASAEKTIAELRSLGTAGVGVKPVDGAAPVSSGEQPGSYQEAVDRKVAGGMSRNAAIDAVNKEFPELRRKYAGRA